MITAETIHGLSLKKAFRGYDMRSVDDFLEQVEQQLTQETQAMEELRRSLAKEKGEKSDLRERIAALTEERDGAISAQHELQKEVDKLKGLTEQYAQDQEKIENSMMDIYRMREMVMRDATAQADETRKAAEEALTQARDKADRIIMEAQEYKAAMDRECELLYEKMTDFRATVLEAYRRQMEAVKAFPEQRPVYKIPGPAKGDDEGKDTVFVSIEED